MLRSQALNSCLNFVGIYSRSLSPCLAAQHCIFWVHTARQGLTQCSRAGRFYIPSAWPQQSGHSAKNGKISQQTEGAAVSPALPRNPQCCSTTQHSSCDTWCCQGWAAPPATQAVSDSVVQWESLTPDRAQTFQGTFQLHRKFSHWLPSAFLAKTLAQLPALMPNSHKALEHLSHLCCSPVPLHISWFSLTFKLCSYKTVLWL